MLEQESPVKKLRPREGSSKKAKINLVKVAGEDLYHVDELSPAAEEVDEEDWAGEGDESEEDEVNGSECLRCDGEYEAEGEPEEWIDRVGAADEVEEKRPQKMQEGSAKGFSYLTTCNVHDWRKKPYHHKAGTTSKRWKRRSRLVAREYAFAEGRRDDVFQPATSGHVLKLLPTIFLQ